MTVSLENSRVTVGVVLVDGAGRVLMQLRDDRPDVSDPGCWTIPGGGAEPAESPEEAARREFLEETGYRLSRLVPVHSDTMQRPDGMQEFRHFYASEYDGAQPIGCFEGQQVRFMAAHEREGLRTTLHLNQVIEEALEVLLQNVTGRESRLHDEIARLLACPRCHSPVQVRDEEITCQNASCAWRGTIADGIAVMTEEGMRPSYFDDKTGTMRHGYSGAASNSVFYERQGRIVEDTLRPSTVVLDVGCGPLMPYRRTGDYVVIGLDLSWQSLVENTELDLRVYASGSRLPVPDHSIDTIVCMYAIHHFAGSTIAESTTIVRAAFSEFGRALKSGGDLLVFEVAPKWPFAILQTALWDLAKRAARRRLDMFFWGSGSLLRLGSAALPSGAAVTVEGFSSPWWTTFPPIFALPWLRIPRLFYPFDVRLYKWSMP